MIEFILRPATLLVLAAIAVLIAVLTAIQANPHEIGHAALVEALGALAAGCVIGAALLHRRSSN